MRCEEIRELLPGYVDADPHDVPEIGGHLATCDACTEVLHSYRSMLAELSVLPDGDRPAPAALVERILAFIPEPSLLDRIRRSVREHPTAYVAGLGGAALATAAVAIALRRARSAQPIATA